MVVPLTEMNLSTSFLDEPSRERNCWSVKKCPNQKQIPSVSLAECVLGSQIDILRSEEQSSFAGASFQEIFQPETRGESPRLCGFQRTTGKSLFRFGEPICLAKRLWEVEFCHDTDRRTIAAKVSSKLRGEFRRNFFECFRIDAPPPPPPPPPPLPSTRFLSRCRSSGDSLIDTKLVEIIPRNGKIKCSRFVNRRWLKSER